MNMEQIQQLLVQYGAKLLKGILILIIGCVFVHYLLKLCRSAMRKNPNIRMEATLGTFLNNLVRVLLYMTVILTAAGAMGVPLTTVVALLGSAGVAFSLAMQGALSNLIGGVMLLILKPIRADEFVKVGDVEGSVKGIGVFYTDLVTFDGKHVSMPNSSLTNTPIINFTREGRRRVDVGFSVSYDTPIDRVMEVLNQVVRETEHVLPDPAPAVKLTACGASSMDYAIRLWTKTSDYWDVYFFLLEHGKRALDAAGIRVPYPQLDVHLDRE
ncbi:MAG: mechanosensitive ion channel [Clostridia bacterium]|nr:mechanosensitive ion channel [Clostridia bacterium]MBR4458899.1 mechanosensitive ion channel [Clostridia bacterium]